MALTTVPASLSATALTLTTAAQPNITSVGTLTGLTVSGNIAGTLTTAAQTNITSLGTLTSLTTSGSVGIKTTAASGVALDIRENSTTTAVDIRNANASGYGLYVAGGSSSSQYALRAADKDNNALFSVMGDGNVGIGGTPGSGNLLNVFPNSGNLAVKAGRVDSTNNVRLEAGGTTSTYLEYRGYLGHIWDVDTTEVMRINSSGNVVINKSNFSSLPTGSKLNIFGDGTTLRLDGSSATTKSILFRNVNAGNPGEVYADGSLRFRTEDASTRITFHTNSSGSNNERMRIDEYGKIGIGVTPPAHSNLGELLSVNGANLIGVGTSGGYVGYNMYYNSGWKYQAAAASAVISFESDGDLTIRQAGSGSAGAGISYSENFHLDAAGHLGLGMDPSQALDINASDGLSIRFYQSGTFRAGLQVADSSGQMAGTSAAQDFVIRSQSNLLFTSNGNTERMRIDGSGNLLVAQQTANSNSVGTSLRTDGRVFFCADGNYSGHFNRKSSDGAVVHIAKDDTVVGSIGATGGDLFIGTGDVGIWFQDGGNAIRPFHVTSVAGHGSSIDIGHSSERFKDLYLSGDISIVGGSSGGTITVDPTSGDAELLLQGAAGAQTLRLDQNSIRTTTNSPLSIFVNNLSNRRIYLSNSTSNTTQHLVGIGTASPQAALDINGSYNVNNTSDAIFRVLKNNGNDWSIRAEAGSDDYAYIAMGNGSYAYYVYNQPASAGRGRWNYNGEIYLNGGSSAIYNINSDARLKEEISDAPSQWELIKGLPLQRFKWIDRREGEKWSYGFIAQEVEKTNPEFVELVPQDKEDADKGVEDPKYKTVAEGQIHERALAALQEAMKRIEALEAEVKALKGE